MLARAITHVENGSNLGKQISNELVAQSSRGFVIGITGPPGAGKSTLVDRLISSYRKQGLTVGVIAVDPSSPFSHGAILGDRIRMLQSTGDEGVFIRSMATRGHLGGLNSVIFEILNLYRAFGFDRIIVETVGAGQSEVDVMKYCQTTVVVSVPGLGDGIQILKAGILEIADIFVVNKSDLTGAEQIQSQIRNLLNLIPEERVWTPPVIALSAINNEGIDNLVDSIDRHHKYLVTSGEGESKVLTQIGETLLSEVQGLVEKKLRKRLLKEYSNEILLSQLKFDDAVTKLLEEMTNE